MGVEKWRMRLLGRGEWDEMWRQLNGKEIMTMRSGGGIRNELDCGTRLGFRS